jgi:hypothetical protein
VNRLTRTQVEWERASFEAAAADNLPQFSGHLGRNATIPFRDYAEPMVEFAWRLWLVRAATAVAALRAAIRGTP